MCDFNENGNRIISDNLWLASDRIRGEGRGGGATVKPNETKPKDFHNKSAACGAYEFNDLITHTDTHTHKYTCACTPLGACCKWHALLTLHACQENLSKKCKSGSREIPKWNSTSQHHRTVFPLSPNSLPLPLPPLQAVCPGGRRCNAHCRSY